MKELGFLASNYLAFLLVSSILVSLQSSLWPQLLGVLPSPQLWIPTLVFWTLYRRTFEGLVMVYLITALVCGASAVPLGILLAINIILFISIYFVKQRIFFEGPIFFMLTCGATSLAFPLLHLIISWIFETNPIVHVKIITWTLSSLLTMLCAMALHRFYEWIDRTTHKERNPELGGGFL